MVKDSTAHTRAATGGDAWIPNEDPAPRRLSPLRVAVFLAVLSVIGYGVVAVASRRSQAAGARQAAPWFAPYVDVTLTPTYPFQSPAADPVSRAFLSFVVSRSASEPCTPSWGGYYTLAQAQAQINLDERIAQLRSQGGDVMIAFGGQANTELAVGCTDPAALRRAYLLPVERYHASAIDLDIEGAALDDTAANRRRAQALAAIQRLRPGLRVWLTLPISAGGLQADAVAAVRAMLAAHVRLLGVNALAMDFGQGAGSDMLGTVTRSIEALHAQLQTLYPRLGATAAWHHIGVTVMIGRNDTPGELFTVADARRLTAFVAAKGIARLSAWSLNRDSACGGVFHQVGVLSNTCSGVRQTPLQFTAIFSSLPGTGVAATAAELPVPAVQAAAPDDPATSPYPIWQANVAYSAGYKVVWHRLIYQAKWWSQGTAPDAGTGYGASPWLLIGPVAPGSTAPKPVLAIGGAHPSWSPSTVYRQGDVVTFQGLPYQAKWYTQGEQPDSALPANPTLPWTPMFNLPGEPTTEGQ